MAATAERPVAAAPTSATETAAGAPSPPDRPAPPVDGSERAMLLRLAAFTALALYGALLWFALVVPTARGVGVLTVLAAAAGALALARVRRPATAPGRVALLAAAGVAGVLLALVPAGTPLRFLAPDAWGDLLVALADGIATTPGIAVPYRGTDEWVRTAILAGAGALLALAALLAFWPRRGGRRGWPLGAAAALGVLYTVPVVEQSPGSPFASGAGFAVLAAALLWLERLERGRLAVGAAVIGAAAALGLAVAPALDRDRPWFDYEEFAESLEPETPAAYMWDHRYGPLDWPRDGRELLRIKADSASYWKATTLDVFDGVSWRRSSTFAADDETDGVVNAERPEWRQEITVSVRNLTSRQVVGAGTTLRVDRAPRGIADAGQGTFFKTGRPLERGSTYAARVYVPQPNQGDLRAASAADLDARPTPYRAMELPAELLAPGTEDAFGAAVRAPVTIGFPAYGGPGPPVVVWPNGVASPDRGREVLEDSAYGRWYRLAQELKAESTGMYDFVRRVRDRVQRGAVYTERPQGGRLPLDTFLFESRAGYCQHFSGAAALLLRMGGVPTRIAAGFSPGSYDRRRGEYVVRDVDAHSWVEAFLPGIGWHTVDPTPGVAPARSQQEEDSEARNPNAQPAPDLGGGRDLPGDVAGAGLAEQDGAGPSPLAAVLAALAAFAAAAGMVLLARRGRVPGGAVSPELAELQRALHRSGRVPQPDTTLARLEAALRDEPDAAAYVRRLRAARYGAAADGPPGTAERRGLRRALGSGLGWRGRLRALWAVPPRPAELRPRALRRAR